jgi:hypothetical protein
MSDQLSSVTVIGVVPIPAGHTIEVHTFASEELGGRKLNDPLIVDLDDGVTYGEHWHFASLNSFTIGKTIKLPAEVREDLRKGGKQMGRVAYAQVVWILTQHPFPQTTIYFTPF